MLLDLRKNSEFRCNRLDCLLHAVCGSIVGSHEVEPDFREQIRSLELSTFQCGEHDPQRDGHIRATTADVNSMNAAVVPLEEAVWLWVAANNVEVRVRCTERQNGRGNLAQARVSRLECFYVGR